MIEAVLVFGLIISLFEFVVIAMIPPKTRLTILGSVPKKMLFHVTMGIGNLLVHWGSMTGTMSATLAFILSIGVMWIAEKTFGSLTGGRYYKVGLVKYSVEELK